MRKLRGYIDHRAVEVSRIQSFVSFLSLLSSPPSHLPHSRTPPHPPQTQSLAVIKGWLKESTFTQGSGGYSILIHVLRSIVSLKVTEEVRERIFGVHSWYISVCIVAAADTVRSRRV